MSNKLSSHLNLYPIITTSSNLFQKWDNIALPFDKEVKDRALPVVLFEKREVRLAYLWRHVFKLEEHIQKKTC